MNLLVCDDDRQDLDRITALLAGPCQDIGAKLVATSRPEELEDLSRSDLAFLDIDMKEMNGLTLARRLRAARPDAVIVFITNFVQYAPEGYEVQAFRYLLKPALEEKLPACFALAVEELRRRRRSIIVRSEGEAVELPLRDIGPADGHRPSAPQSTPNLPLLFQFNRAGPAAGRGGISAGAAQLSGPYGLYPAVSI